MLIVQGSSSVLDASEDTILWEACRVLGCDLLIVTADKEGTKTDYNQIKDHDTLVLSLPKKLQQLLDPAPVLKGRAVSQIDTTIVNKPLVIDKEPDQVLVSDNEPDQGLVIDKAPDHGLVSDNEPDQGLVIDKAPDQGLVIDKAPDQGLDNQILELIGTAGEEQGMFLSALASMRRRLTHTNHVVSNSRRVASPR